MNRRSTYEQPRRGHDTEYERLLTPSEAKQKVHPLANERALLLGGECDFKTVDVKSDQTELMIALPDTRELTVQVWDEISALSAVPINCDLKVARYYRSYYLKHKNQIVGCIFEWDETR